MAHILGSLADEIREGVKILRASHLPRAANRLEATLPKQAKKVRRKVVTLGKPGERPRGRVQITDAKLLRQIMQEGDSGDGND